MLANCASSSLKPSAKFRSEQRQYERQGALTGCGRGSRRYTARLDIKAEGQCIMGVYTRMMIGTIRYGAPRAAYDR
jgi:hypothetical protein